MLDGFVQRTTRIIPQLFRMPVLATVAMVLAEQGEAALPELRKVYQADHPASCMFAAIALSQIQHPRAREIFDEGAASTFIEARKWAEKLSGQRAVDLAVRALLAQ